MYVRTKKGEIFECYESEQMHKPIYYPKKSKTKGYIDYEDVYKKSNNIIDILEVGDYVNGSYIYSVVEENKNTGQPRVLFTEEDGVLGNGDIKSIVTHEQMEAMEYKIER